MINKLLKIFVFAFVILALGCERNDITPVIYKNVRDFPSIMANDTAVFTVGAIEGSPNFILLTVDTSGRDSILKTFNLGRKAIDITKFQMLADGSFVVGGYKGDLEFWYLFGPDYSLKNFLYFKGDIEDIVPIFDGFAILVKNYDMSMKANRTINCYDLNGKFKGKFSFYYPVSKFYKLLYVNEKCDSLRMLVSEDGYLGLLSYSPKRGDFIFKPLIRDEFYSEQVSYADSLIFIATYKNAYVIDFLSGRFALCDTNLYDNLEMFKYLDSVIVIYTGSKFLCYDMSTGQKYEFYVSSDYYIDDFNLVNNKLVIIGSVYQDFYFRPFVAVKTLPFKRLISEHKKTKPARDTIVSVADTTKNSLQSGSEQKTKHSMLSPIYWLLGKIKK